MNHTKIRITTLILGLLLFNSCIVKSLFPFFTKDTIHFEKYFLGIWEDSKKKDNRWIITSVEDVFIIEKTKDTTPLSKEGLKIYNNYKHGYYAIYEEKKSNRTSIFLAMPFKINNQLFLDFTPFLYDEDTNDLVSYHLAATHSLAKFDILENGSVNIKWLASRKIAKLIENNKIKIKHEKLMPSDEYLLTASSVELQKFIKKYMTSNDDNKWETDVEFNLKRNHSKEDALNLIRNILNKKYT